MKLKKINNYILLICLFCLLGQGMQIEAAEKSSAQQNSTTLFTNVYNSVCGHPWVTITGTFFLVVGCTAYIYASTKNSTRNSDRPLISEQSSRSDDGVFSQGECVDPNQKMDKFWRENRGKFIFGTVVILGLIAAIIRQIYKSYMNHFSPLKSSENEKSSKS